MTAYQARREIARAVDKATQPGEPSRREALAVALAAELTAKSDSGGTDETQQQAKHSATVRNVLCQFLGQIATDDQVPALVVALGDLETREMARCALERIPAVGASKALSEALEQVGPEFRIGVVNALARQRWLHANTALRRAAQDPDTEVRMAAIRGLANFPEASNGKLIVAATKTGSRSDRARAQKARVRLAQTLRRAGLKEPAITIFRSILADEMEGPWKTAARLTLEQLKTIPSDDD